MRSLVSSRRYHSYFSFSGVGAYSWYLLIIAICLLLSPLPRFRSVSICTFISRCASLFDGHRNTCRFLSSQDDVDILSDEGCVRLLAASIYRYWRHYSPFGFIAFSLANAFQVLYIAAALLYMNIQGMLGCYRRSRSLCRHTESTPLSCIECVIILCDDFRWDFRSSTAGWGLPRFSALRTTASMNDFPPKLAYFSPYWF